MSQPYDVIIIGSGAGGGTLAYHLANAGKRILILERGPFLPQEKMNWDTSSVFLDNRYHTKETWTDKKGNTLHPGTGYWVGGNTKVYGAAMFRLRKEDFNVLHHKGGISPEWPVKYDVFEPYYTKAEKLFCVHGKLGLDPTEPFHSEEYPFPAISNEPRMQEIQDDVAKLGYHPFPVPLGLKRNESDLLESKCIRCDTCDGYPCLVHAKSDADINCIRAIMHLPNVTLVTEAKVTRLVTNAAGIAVESVEAELRGSGQTEKFSGSIVAVCCGAINSAALLLRSANEKHPRGLANSSDMVGRHFMFHQADAILALSFEANPSKYMKTFGVNDFYFGEPDYPYPMGNVQPIGSFHHEMMKGDAPAITPEFVLEKMTAHAVPWWLTTEDLPDPNNRVQVINGQIQLDYTNNNVESFQRLKDRWIDVLKKAGHAESSVPMHAYFKKRIPLEGVGHQNGTCRFGVDPKQSVLDVNCCTHDIDNLYVVDASFFPSCGAVNPSLTVIANALRVGDHLVERLT
ncbi:MAG TPA: GMC family oxidoreductase [Acidobacteriaceae bacterium]|jgi:choline dehydrogenase-like flavoprotein|nr:GMC family oxidoreductase [Acidobacteriaceae bacterium]